MSRIIEQGEASGVSDDDYVLLSSPTLGERKYKAKNLKGSGSVVTLTLSEYNALSQDEKMNGTVYIVQNVQQQEEELISRVNEAQNNITCSSFYGTDYSGAEAPYKGAWKAFNNVAWTGNTSDRDNVGWAPNYNGTEGWLKYEFDEAKQITEVKINVFGRNNAWSDTVYIDGSNDDNTWTTLKSFSCDCIKYLNTSTGTDYTNAISDTTKYKYIRVRLTQANGLSFCLAEMWVKGINEVITQSLYYLGDEYVLAS